MPKTLFQNIVFTLMMSFLMVYAMICYNISLNTGGMSNSVFLAAFHELIIMWPVAFLLEFLFVDKAAHAHLHYVSLHEPCCHYFIQACRASVCSRVAPDHLLKLPSSFLLAAFLLRSIYPSDLPQAFSREISLHKQWIRVIRADWHFLHMIRFIFYSVRTLIHQQSPKLVLTDSNMGLMLIASANLITKIR